MEKTAKHPVQTTEKTLRLVEALKNSGSCGITELADRLNMGKSAVHNHLATLEQHGYVVSEAGKYRLGLKFLDIGGYTRSQMDLYKTAESEVKQLAMETGERANLLTEEHGMGIYLYRANGNRAVDLDTYTGVRTYLHTSALGKAILATMSEERTEAILDRHGLPATTPGCVTDRDELYDELETIREDGFAVDDEERMEGLRCIAMPITSTEGNSLGAISISAPSSRMKGTRFQETIPELLSGAVNMIELNLNYS
ncbi:transcriptional regulator, IclR family [Haladaptatus litoreus]|uniref:Transcriptional regulator, IclR family n=1 Tax=Haladaptatus litoreus TaxID=553468 RepID=A0A1N7DI11_9EURY|nr:IclR family transcriptional regulator [Haladaptatus litoreus]SIR75424.1 transcriptional regulator, IclR family [Haladaptatus litoreus]